jgi:hypothetical protein
LEKALDDGSWAGLFSIDPKTAIAEGRWQTSVGYHIPIFVPGIFEAMVDNIKLVEAHPIIAQSFAEYTIKRIMPLAGNIPVGHGVMRVIPIASAIKGHPNAKEMRRSPTTSTPPMISRSLRARAVFPAV